MTKATYTALLDIAIALGDNLNNQLNELGKKLESNAGQAK